MKRVAWVASSYRDLVQCPEEVQDAVGYALYQAQLGEVPESARRMRGDLHSVFEIRTKNAIGDSIFRAAYTTIIGNDVYVLDVFQKKSKHGIETARVDIERIRWRLRQAWEHHEQKKG
jgi:phage-related protein